MSGLPKGPYTVKNLSPVSLRPWRWWYTCAIRREMEQSTQTWWESSVIVEGDFHLVVNAMLLGEGHLSPTRGARGWAVSCLSALVELPVVQIHKWCRSTSRRARRWRTPGQERASVLLNTSSRVTKQRILASTYASGFLSEYRTPA
eukprot:scaffold320114_cov35-Tisochrysis_lutea.AAC.2